MEYEGLVLIADLHVQRPSLPLLRNLKSMVWVLTKYSGEYYELTHWIRWNNSSTVVGWQWLVSLCRSENDDVRVPHGAAPWKSARIITKFRQKNRANKRKKDMVGVAERDCSATPSFKIWDRIKKSEPRLFSWNIVGLPWTTSKHFKWPHVLNVVMNFTTLYQHHRRTYKDLCIWTSNG